MHVRVLPLYMNENKWFLENCIFILQRILGIARTRKYYALIFINYLNNRILINI